MHRRRGDLCQRMASYGWSKGCRSGCPDPKLQSARNYFPIRGCDECIVLSQIQPVATDVHRRYNLSKEGMKKYLFALIASVSLILSLETFTGCGTVNSASYQTVGVTQVTVQTALEAWNQWIALKNPPASQRAAVRAAFEKWKVAMLVVCDAGVVYSSGVQTNAAGQSGFSASLQAAVSNADQSRVDLLNLLASFGVKVK
jgi:hypothetical protein